MFQKLDNYKKVKDITSIVLHDWRRHPEEVNEIFRLEE
jgi:hypothetical protein